MRALGWLLLGLGAGLGGGVLATGPGEAPVLVWLAAGLIVLALALLAASRRARPARPPY